MKTYPEDALPRLAKPLATHNASSFFSQVLALYEPRTSTGKVAIIQPKGKIVQKPTKGPKRSLGTFFIHYPTALGKRSRTLYFNRAMQLEFTSRQIAEFIEAPYELVENFLTKKKFDLTATFTRDTSD